MTSTLGGLTAPSQRGRRRQASPGADPEAHSVALQSAALLLTRPWLARLPLVDEGAGTMEQEGIFTEVCVLAIRWDGPAMGPISHCVVAVPAAAVSGLLETVETFNTNIHVDGPAVETDEVAEVAVLYYGADFLRDQLAESSPMGAQVFAFSTMGTGGLPIGANILDLLDLPEDFSSGTMAKTRLDAQHASEVIVYDVSNEGEDNYVTAVSTAEDDLINPLLALSMPMPSRRQARAASVGGVSARPSALSAVLAPPPQPGTSTRPKAAAAPRAKAGASPQARPKAPSLATVLEAVNNISQRLATIEHQHQQQHQQGQRAAAAPSAVPASGVPSPAACAAPPGLQHASILSPGRFSVPHAPTLNVPGAGASHAQRLVTSMGTNVGPLAATSVTPGCGEPAKLGRARQVDAGLRRRAAVERGGAEANTAVQLAMLEALQKMAGSKPAGAEELDGLLDDESADLDSSIQKLASGARGAAAMYRLHQHIEQNPSAWSARLDQAMFQALGCQHTGMPWSASRYFQERVSFGRHSDLERFAHLLCHLHALHRTQQVDLLGARISQYLKALEQTVLHGGSWRVSWALTGVPEPHPTGALHQGLSSAAELAASVQYMKDAKTIEDLVKKETMPHTTGGAQGASQGSLGPTFASSATPANSTSRRRRGGGKGGSAPESAAKPS
eukprot:6492534-Amphidinium_carterae.2